MTTEVKESKIDLKLGQSSIIIVGVKFGNLFCRNSSAFFHIALKRAEEVYIDINVPMTSRLTDGTLQVPVSKYH